MLEKPDLDEQSLTACLGDAFGVRARALTFLPLGADMGTAVYRAEAIDGYSYFVKLRRGAFAEISVTLPKALSDQGIRQIIAPIPTRSGRLWAELGKFRVILYPFVEGEDGYQKRLSAEQWRELGQAFRRLHAAKLPAELPAELQSQVAVEAYSPQWRESLKTAVGQLERADVRDPIARELIAFLGARRDAVLGMVKRTQILAELLRAHPRDAVLCHTDLHAGNVLIAADGALYLVDWDAPLLAPKERDLMSIGAGLMGEWLTPQEEQALFYAGYGEIQIDPIALSYYRYERIIDDLAVECELILGTGAGYEDRARELRFLKANFAPGGTMALAIATDVTRAAG